MLETGTIAQVHGSDAITHGHHCITWPWAPTSPAVLLFPLPHFTKLGYSLLSCTETEGAREL